MALEHKKKAAGQGDEPALTRRLESVRAPQEVTVGAKFDWPKVTPCRMLPREEVKRAIELNGNCRIPQVFSPAEGCFRFFDPSMYDFFRAWPSDFEYLPVELDPRRFRVTLDGEEVGLRGSSFGRHILEDWQQVDEVLQLGLPPLTEEWKNSLRIEIAKTPGAYHAIFHLAFLFEVLYGLRGMEKFFLDLHDHRAEVENLLDRLVEYDCQMIQAYGEVGVDGVLAGDDWGSQTSLLIDPRTWRELFKPRYKVLVEACHRAGLHAMLHSDGNLDAIFPDLVEIGIDVYHPLQPGAMDVDRWLSEYKGELCFYTGVDVQRVLPFVSPREVKDSVRRAVDKFSSARGGFVLGPTNGITADIPAANLLALHEVLLELR